MISGFRIGLSGIGIAIFWTSLSCTPAMVPAPATAPAISPAELAKVNVESKPIPGIEVIDPEMNQIVDPSAVFTEIASGQKFTEGPVWLPGTKQWVFSDIPADTMYAWSKSAGLSVFRTPAHSSNGNTVDTAGRLITCEQELRRVTRTEPDGSITVLADSHAGKKLNSPNDVIVKSDGSVWFSDPPYGIGQNKKEQAGNFVYRIDPGVREPVAVATDFDMPNGLCFSPDEKVLYIDDSSPARHHVRRFRVTADNMLLDDGIFAVITPHVPDGIRTDSVGRVFCTAGDGVQVFRADGTRLGTFRTPKTSANCCFGGIDGRELLITACSSVWLVPLK